MKKEKKRHWKNLIFTLIIAFAVVSFWRGAWGLMNMCPTSHKILIL